MTDQSNMNMNSIHPLRWGSKAVLRIWHRKYISMIIVIMKNIDVVSEEKLDWIWKIVDDDLDTEVPQKDTTH